MRQVVDKDPSLGLDLQREVTAMLKDRRPFGLNFERHAPEIVELPGRRVRRGDKVRVLPTRGQMPKKADERVWLVRSISKVGEMKSAHLVLQADETETASASIDDLVVVAEFRDPIYPGLVSTGKVELGGDKPYHTVINAENYHALQLLLFTHRAKVDCIYIDPPYNTGARDWKYNNDYVESDDHYRHSKWLAFMERRLLIAKELLNPETSVLIVTIDEKEYLRLGLLLQQLFPEGTIQMVSTVTNRKGNARRGEFSRCEEYLFFIRFGGAAISAWVADMLHEEPDEKTDVRWKSLLRQASTGQTTGRFNLFYPLYFKQKTLEFLRAGEPLPEGVSIETVPTPPGESILWPISKDGSDGRWSLSLGKFNEYIERGFVKFGRANGGGRTPYYLMSGQVDAIAQGSLVVEGRDGDGAVVLRAVTTQKQPMTIWNRPSHSTSGHGTTMLRDLMPDRKFPYPKSLYGVEDALRFATADKPKAVVVDFFAGSGTTAHAVMRLNKQDGGSRQSILVTNNEVAADEQRKLRESSLRPGDLDWEKWGICDFVTKPRIEAAMTGRTPNGDKVNGEYKFSDEFPMSEGFHENAEFFTLTYETQLRVASNRDYRKIAPLLWLRAGARGARIEDIDKGWGTSETYGIIADFDETEQFLEAVEKEPDLKTVFIITDDDWLFESICRGVTEGVEPVRLYEAYLRNFEIEAGRAAR